MLRTKMTAFIVLGVFATSTAHAQRPERFTNWTRPTFPPAEYAAKRGDITILEVAPLLRQIGAK